VEVGTINGTIHETPIIKNTIQLQLGSLRYFYLAEHIRLRHLTTTPRRGGRGRGVGALQVHSIAEK